MEYSGIVSYGSGKANTLGFPTLNIALTDTTVTGIYAGTVLIEGKEYRAGIYADPRRGVLEAHLLNFSGDAYGKEVIITLLTKVRDDEEFPDDESLQQAIRTDIETIRAYFAT